MKIDVRTENCVYITIGDWVVYLDNSTGEKIVEHWEDKLKYAISVSDGHDDDWYYYKNKDDYRLSFEAFVEHNKDIDIHGYVLNSNNEYEVIDSHSAEPQN
jgi:hypothetical protein